MVARHIKAHGTIIIQDGRAMSPYVEREDSANTALLLVLLVIVIMAVVLLGYFLWYAPTYRTTGDTNIRVTVPDSEPDGGTTTPPPPAAGPRQPDQGTYETRPAPRPTPEESAPNDTGTDTGQ